MGTPTHDELCQAAYRLWQERGCPDGSPEVDWRLAEEQLGSGPGEGDVSVTAPSDCIDARARMDRTAAYANAP